MFNGLTDSIKAKLYDFNYTPFMSSFVISWVVINHRYLLVLFADGVELREKVGLLNSISYLAYSCVDFFILPLAFALFYVFIYPKISKYFYEYTLEQTKKLKEIKQKIEDETPITREEAREIRRQIDKLAVERDEAISRLVNTEKTYLNKLQKEVELGTKKITQDNVLLQRELADERQTGKHVFANLEQEISKNQKLEAKLQEFQKVSMGNAIKNDEMQILEYLYRDYKSKSKSGLLDEITVKINIARAKASKIIDDLIKDGILFADLNHPYYIGITQAGNEKLIEIFDGK